MRRTAIVLPLALLVQLSTMVASAPAARANEAHDGVVLLHANALFNRDTTARRASLQWLVTRGDKDAIPALIQALRFSGEDRPLLLDALGRLAGESAGSTWHDWMLWQVTEGALVGPDGTSLSRLPGHIAFWFAWSGFLREDGELATAEN